MKREIKVIVHACDNCKRHDMELRTCIGCGISLCSFCSSKHSEKASRTVRNKYGCGCYGFREFRDFKYDLEILYFCMECLTNPSGKGISRLLALCIKKEKDAYEIGEDKRKYQNKKEKDLDIAWSLIYRQEQKLRKKGVYFPDKDYLEQEG